MTKQQHITHAAREVIAHGMPAPEGDPDRAGRALGKALDAGATLRDIGDEIKRQRAT